MNDWDDAGDLEVLRSLRGDGIEPSEADLACGRARFEREIADRARSRGVDRAARSRRRSPRGLLWAGGGLLAAGALAGTLLVVAPSPVTPRDTHVEAVELLRKASEQVRFEDLSAGPGRVVRIDDFGVRLVAPRQPVRDGVGGTVLWDAPLEPSPVVFRVEGRFVSILTGDRNDDVSAQLDDRIVELYGDPETPVELHFSPEPEPAGDFVGRGMSLWDDWQSIDLEMLKSGANGGAIDSRFVDESGTLIAVPHFAPERAASLPRDPEALREHALGVIRAAGVTPEHEGEELFAWLVPLIAYEHTPAELRAAAYEVMSGLDGIVISDYEATLGNLTGTGVSFESDPGVRIELVLDPDTGRLIGFRQVLTRENPLIPSVPPGTVILSWSSEYTIVDRVPCLADVYAEAGMRFDVTAESDGLDPWCGAAGGTAGVE